MKYSIVNFSQVKDYKHFRFDSQFYDNELLQAYQILEKKPIELNRHICLIKSGTTPAERDDNLREGIILLKTTDIRNNILTAEEPDIFYYIDAKTNQRMKATQLNENDVLINIVGATTDVIGRTAILFNDFPKANITQAMAFCRLKNDELLPEYLYAFLQGYYGQVQVKRLARPTGQYNLNLDELGDFRIPILDSKFQERIKRVISFAHEQSKISKQLYRQAEACLLKELGLLNWRPQRRLFFVRNYSEAENANRLDAEYFQPKYDLLIDAINKTGQAVRLGDCLTQSINRGLLPNYVDEGDIPVINSKHVGKTHVILERNRFTSSKFALQPKNRRGLIKQYDVLLNSTGYITIGRCQTMLDETPAFADGHVAIIRPNSKLDPVYLGCFLNAMTGRLQTEKGWTGSSGQIELRQEVIANFTIWEAPKDVQKTIRQDIENSHKYRQSSQRLPRLAGRAIEIAIEQNEIVAEAWLDKEIIKLNSLDFIQQHEE
jgi:restriction endonuclease S subunit